ncbi:MAG: glutathione-regulated potassium-efflux system oxidoreductase KefF [Burkholderiaceae bacterium]
MPATPHILVIYAHPASHRSRINHQLLEAAKSLPNIQVHDLYETYPDFHIDIPREQELLAAADLVVFQHPIHWYSMPSLLKEWVDAVLEQGWAYGPGGTRLHGKDYWLVATTGGTTESYQKNGYHHHPFSAFLPPFEQTARLCGMRWLAPHILHGAHQVDESVVAKHVATYLERLRAYPHWPELISASNTITHTPQDQ